MSIQELWALGRAEVQEVRLRSGRSEMEDQTEEIRLLKEQLAAKNEELRTGQEELTVAKESMSSLESQLHTVRLKSEVDKLRAVEQLRQHGDGERQLLQAGKDEEIMRISMDTDQLKSLNKAL